MKGLILLCTTILIMACTPALKRSVVKTPAFPTSAVEYALMTSHDLSWIDSLSLEELNKQNRWKRSALTYAILMDDTEMVKKLLEKGVKTDIPDRWNSTPTEYAAVIYSRRMKDQFPQKQIDAVDTVKAREKYLGMKTVLDSAVYQLKRITDDHTGGLPILKEIDPNTPHQRHENWDSYSTPISILAKKRYARPLELLIEEGAFINGRDAGGDYSLWAADWEDSSMLMVLLDLGADPNPVNHRGVHISRRFTEKGDTLLVDALYRRGMRLERSTLIEAIDDNDVPMARYLSSRVPLDTNRYFYDDIADLNDSVILNNLITTEMIDSNLVEDICQSTNLQTITWLLGKGVPLTEMDRRYLASAQITDTTLIDKIISELKEPETPGRMLETTAEKSNYVFAKRLVEHIGSIPDSLQGIVGYPAFKGDSTMINWFLKHGADLNAPTRYYHNLPLSLAAEGRQSGAFLAWMIDKGADINGKHPDYGYTALYKTTESRSWDAFDTLIARGADPMIQTSRGKTFHYTIYGNDSVFIRIIDNLIKKYPEKDPLELAGLHVFDTSGQSFFNYVCENGGLPVLDYLLEIGKSKDFPDKKELRQGLVMAAGSYREDKIERLIALGAPYNGVDPDSNNILHFAIYDGNDSLFLRALDNGAPINGRNSAGVTPLLFALRERGRYESDRWWSDSLLDRGADINMADTGGTTPLCEVRDIDRFREFLKRGASVDVVFRKGGSLLIDAVSGYRSEEITMEIIKHIKRPDEGKGWRGTALTYAVEKGNKEYVKALVKRGANVNYPSVLETALEKNDSSMIELLFELGAKPGKQNSLYLLKDAKDMALFNKLLDMGADPDGRGFAQKTLLMYLAGNSANIPKVKIIIESGADLNAVDRQKDNALNYAATDGDSALFHLLLEHGADPTVSKDLPLVAINGKNLSIIKKVLEVRPDTDTLTVSGINPLFYAAKVDGKGEILSLLIEEYGNVNRFVNGMTPLMAAVLTRNCVSTERLIEAGADVTAKSEKLHRTPLHYAAICEMSYSGFYSKKEEDDNRITQLLNAGADINALDSEGRTPLIWAVKMYNSSAAKQLIRLGADISITDKSGRTARSYFEKGLDPEEYGFLIN